MKELCLEVWNSNQNRQERHYFLVDELSGVEEGQYLCGVNPELVSSEQEQQILKLLGYQ